MEQTQIHLRLPPDLHEQMSERAKELGVSLNSLMVDLLSEQVPTDECPMCHGVGHVPAYLAWWLKQREAKAAARTQRAT